MKRESTLTAGGSLPTTPFFGAKLSFAFSTDWTKLANGKLLPVALLWPGKTKADRSATAKKGQN